MELNFRHVLSTSFSRRYAVDSLILLIQSIIADQAALEFQPSFPRGLTVAAYVGMLAGALFWGMSADVIGRKFAFNTSLLLCSVFAIIAGSSPSWVVLGFWVALAAFGAGGNLVLDTAVFLEYLPSKYQWLLTLMAAWWGENTHISVLHVLRKPANVLDHAQDWGSLLPDCLLGFIFQIIAALSPRPALITTTVAGVTSGTPAAQLYSS